MALTILAQVVRIAQRVFGCKHGMKSWKKIRSNQIIPLFFYMVDYAFTSMRLNGKNLRQMGF